MLSDPVTTVQGACKRNLDGGSWTQARAESIYESHKTPASHQEVEMDEDSNERAYLSGYADGEGCFCVSFNRSSRHKFGWEIRPSFSVSQNGDRAEVLELFQRILGCGTLRPDRSDRTLKFETRSVSDLATRVIPQFERYPLLSSKRNDFEKFAAIVQLMHEGAHLQPDGFAQIVQLAASLNVSSKKRFERAAITPEMNV